jgi:hypothetical protein
VKQAIDEYSGLISTEVLAKDLSGTEVYDFSEKAKIGESEVVISLIRVGNG